ncbi:MAG: VPLPA-CTERM-specific exosortase XrtD [Deltaproteobacteria bacterium]|nr:VPLPA-CTERM-specific exosortase XrtD [Deltaproteobacteria bacterium]
MKTLLVIAGYALLLGGLYFDSLAYMVRRWQAPDYNYCFLMPLVAVYLFWASREAFRARPARPTFAALPLLLVGLGFYWLGELGGEFMSLNISLWLVIVALVWLHYGWQRLRAVWFALFMLAFAIPLPNFLHQKVSWHLKLISTRIGVLLMQLLGMSAYREGNVIDLGFTQLQVVDACSGLRYLFPIIILSLLLAWSYRAYWWKKLLLVLSSIPLIVVSNSIRIAVTGLLYEHIGPAAAEGFFHDFAGWFMFMVALAVLLPEMWLLNRIFPGRPPREVPVKVKSAAGSRPSPWPVFLVAVFCLAATLAFSHGIEFREKVPARRAFATFPETIDGWRGRRQVMEQQFIDALDLSDYTIVDYQNDRGRAVNFYVAYYESQRKGESIHSPATCLPSSGWNFEQAGEIAVQIPGGRRLRVRRALMSKGDMRQVVYYWFPQRGRDLTNAYQLKFYAFWDALTKHRTDGALVRLITPVYADETVAAADRRLQEFLRQVVPVLDTYLPGK